MPEPQIKGNVLTRSFELPTSDDTVVGERRPSGILSTDMESSTTGRFRVYRRRRRRHRRRSRPAEKTADNSLNFRVSRALRVVSSPTAVPREVDRKARCQPGGHVRDGLRLRAVLTQRGRSRLEVPVSQLQLFFSFFYCFVVWVPPSPLSPSLSGAHTQRVKRASVCE